MSIYIYNLLKEIRESDDKAILKCLFIYLNEKERHDFDNRYRNYTKEKIKQKLELWISQKEWKYKLDSDQEYKIPSPSDNLINLLQEFSLSKIVFSLYEQLTFENKINLRIFLSNPPLQQTKDYIRFHLHQVYKKLYLNIRLYIDIREKYISSYRYHLICLFHIYKIESIHSQQLEKYALDSFDGDINSEKSELSEHKEIRIEPLYLERLSDNNSQISIEEECKNNIDTGQITRIKGLSKTGKTWLIIKQLIPHATQKGYLPIYIDFNSVKSYINNFQTQERLLELDKWFYSFFFKQIIRHLNLTIDQTNKLENLMDKIQDSSDFLYYFNQVVHDHQKKIILFLDNIDVIIEKEDIIGFGKNLRSWNESESIPKNKVNFLMTYSTDIYIHFQNIHTSPLENIGRAQRLSDFNHEQIKNIAEQKEVINLLTKEDDMIRIYKLIGGNPELVMIFFDYLKETQREVSSALNNIERYQGKFNNYHGVFADHLFDKLQLLKSDNNQARLQNFIEILENDKPFLISHIVHAFQLENMGLIKKYNKNDYNNLYIPKYELYRKFFLLDLS